ncbi:MAG: hypothetical protein M3382_03090 [Thermoproteota archaeon]|nr:hypothetical protein [Thermoproteota archaeon]
MMKLFPPFNIMSSAIPNLLGYDDMVEYYEYYNTCGNVSENFDLSLPLLSGTTR